MFRLQEVGQAIAAKRLKCTDYILDVTPLRAQSCKKTLELCERDKLPLAPMPEHHRCDHSVLSLTQEDWKLLRPFMLGSAIDLDWGSRSPVPGSFQEPFWSLMMQAVVKNSATYRARIHRACEVVEWMVWKLRSLNELELALEFRRPAYTAQATKERMRKEAEFSLRSDTVAQQKGWVRGSLLPCPSHPETHTLNHQLESCVNMGLQLPASLHKHWTGSSLGDVDAKLRFPGWNVISESETVLTLPDTKEQYRVYEVNYNGAAYCPFRILQAQKEEKAAEQCRQSFPFLNTAAYHGYLHGSFSWVFQRVRDGSVLHIPSLSWHMMMHHDYFLNQPPFAINLDSISKFFSVSEAGFEQLKLELAELKHRTRMHEHRAALRAKNGFTSIYQSELDLQKQGRCRSCRRVMNPAESPIATCPTCQATFYCSQRCLDKDKAEHAGGGDCAKLCSVPDPLARLLSAYALAPIGEPNQTPAPPSSSSGSVSAPPPSSG